MAMFIQKKEIRGMCDLFQYSHMSLTSGPNCVEIELKEDHAPSPAGCMLKQDTDFSGNDLLRVPNLDANACCTRCQQTSGCGAFTYSPNDACYLKTAGAGAKSVGGKVSGTVSNTPTPAPAPTPPRCICIKHLNFMSHEIGQKEETP
jgi:hypothetical protein